MGDKGEGGVKNIKKWVTSFMDGPRKRLGLITQPHLHKYLDTASYFFWWSTYRNIFMIGICMSQYVCLCNISLMLLLWIDLQNAYLEQKKVISVYSTIYCICMLCYACHTRLIYNKLRKVCFWQCFKFLLFAFCHRSLVASSFIIIHFALTLENFLVLYFWKLDIRTNK